MCCEAEPSDPNVPAFPPVPRCHGCHHQKTPERTPSLGRLLLAKLSLELIDADSAESGSLHLLELAAVVELLEVAGALGGVLRDAERVLGAQREKTYSAPAWRAMSS